MHADALKMSARQVMGLPLPVDVVAWDVGAAAFRLVHEAGKAPLDEARYERAVIDFGEKMCAAYRVVGDDLDALMGWWLGRLGISAHLKDLSSIPE